MVFSSSIALTFERLSLSLMLALFWNMLLTNYDVPSVQHR